jgi:dipeptidyl aminopeptidase/acylaminoacyl peptidase
VDELPGGDLLVVLESMASPGELYRWSEETGEVQRLISVSAGEASIAALREPTDLWFDGADGDAVHGLLLEPPHRKEGEKLPLVVFIHGGPQGAFGDHFHFRWNPQVIADAGYGVLLLNPRGSTGYGQKFCDQITGDWGGRIIEDIHAGIDHALASADWLDPERVGATGGSFGGFMMNWMQGHTDRFKALVCHAGIFNLWNLYYGTEELWFPEWEFGGAPHDDPTLYDRWNPVRHVDKWATPMLILHGQLDFRVPYLEGVGAFTALQTRGVPSRMVLFPDEGHWIGKPQNAVLWYGEMIAFFDAHLR